MADDANKMLEEQQKELERIRSKRRKGIDTSKLRRALNVIFLLLAAVGIVLYFVPGHRDTGIIVIIIGMIVKIIEFFVRFLL